MRIAVHTWSEGSLNKVRVFGTPLTIHEWRLYIMKHTLELRK